MSKMQPPSVNQLVQGIGSALENATNLLEDARVLQKATRYHTALALAILAMEELGKVSLFVAFDRYEREARTNEWWSSLQAHNPKQQQFLLGGILHREDRDPILDLVNSPLLAKALHDLKMKALYVDWDGTEFHLPQQIEDIEGKAIAFIAEASEGLERSRKLLNGLTVQRLESIRQAQKEFLAATDDEGTLEIYLKRAQAAGMEATEANAIREISRMKRAFAHYTTTTT